MFKATASTEIDSLFPGDEVSQRLDCSNVLKQLITISSNNTYIVSYTIDPPAFLSKDLRLKNDSTLISDQLGFVDWIIVQEACGIERCNKKGLTVFGAKNLYVINKDQEGIYDMISHFLSITIAVIYPWDNVSDYCTYTLPDTSHQAGIIKI